jgi:hypothetical protein
MTPAIASVVIPAHDEARGIGRTLRALSEGLERHRLEVVVVCNGCTDDTAEVVRSRFPHVRVLEIAEPSKLAAVAVGNAAATVFPRVHLDADVSISGSSLRALVGALGGDVLASAPSRVVELSRSQALVRAYYHVWNRLPQVRQALFGRGVFVLSEEGQRRVSALPSVMSDDLAVSSAFAPHERRVLEEAEVVVVAPRTVADLVRRRTRVATGNAQACGSGVGVTPTTMRTLLRLALTDPGVALRLPVFVGVTLVARQSARKAIRTGDFATWLRDESSRAA